jgi:transcriptional regulator with XRE-family HTH domain
VGGGAGRRHSAMLIGTTKSLPPTALQRARRARKISQSVLSRLTRVHPSSISQAERSGSITLALAERLAPALGCKPEDLLEADGQP